MVRRVQLYPTPDKAHIEFPEMKYPRYRRRVALAISGGSMRSFSAAIGQISALRHLDLLPEIGAFSTLSGSSWFGALFNYLDSSISDETMLGEYTHAAPESLSLKKLGQMDSSFIGYPIQQMTDGNLIKSIHQVKEDGFPLNRRFSGALGKILLGHFGLFDPKQYFSLDKETVSEIISNSSDLFLENFVAMRPDRPYWIASSSAVNIQRHPAFMHHFEYTPLYSGTAQIDDGFGGGYIQNIGFNTDNPIAVFPDRNAVINPPEEFFTLFDLMGSSGAAPAIIFDKLKMPGLLAEFKYWPVSSPMETKAETYSFGDGGDLEDTALVALLRRKYPTIISFINGEYPLGSTDKNCVMGVNGNISRLFGLPPKSHVINDQDTHIFDNEVGGSSTFTPFEKLVAGFNETKQSKSIPFHLDSYRLAEDNPFGLEPYPVKILWIYNDMNAGWKERLPDDIRRLLSKRVSEYHLHNFPNYKTIFQDDLQVFTLKPEQIQLLANMWHFSLCEGTLIRRTLEEIF
jgi:hypothetical protein